MTNRNRSSRIRMVYLSMLLTGFGILGPIQSQAADSCAEVFFPLAVRARQENLRIGREIADNVHMRAKTNYPADLDQQVRLLFENGSRRNRSLLRLLDEGHFRVVIGRSRADRERILSEGRIANFRDHPSPIGEKREARDSKEAAMAGMTVEEYRQLPTSATAVYAYLEPTPGIGLSAPASAGNYVEDKWILNWATIRDRITWSPFISGGYGGSQPVFPWSRRALMIPYLNHPTELATSDGDPIRLPDPYGYLSLPRTGLFRGIYSLVEIQIWGGVTAADISSRE